jgi:hypothetical protein
MGLRQLVEQLLRILEVSGVECLGGPVVGRREQVVSLGRSTLVASEASAVGCSAQLQGLCLLAPGRIKLHIPPDPWPRPRFSLPRFKHTSH